MDEIQPMTEGGQWLAMGGTGTPHYVTNPDHVARMLREGHQIIADPRRPAEPEQAPEPENEPEKDETEDDDTTRRLTTAKPTNKAGARGLDTTP